MIRALLFDCFGVLVDPVYESFWPKIPKRAVNQILVYNEAADLGQIPDRERERQVITALNSEGLNGQNEIATAYAQSQRRSDLMDFILRARAAGYKTAMLSNIADNIHKVFSEADIQKYFDDAILSYQVHLTKPQAEIYRLAAQRLHVKTNECVFVDDKEANVAAAEKVGMCGILYKNFTQFHMELDKLLGER